MDRSRLAFLTGTAAYSRFGFLKAAYSVSHNVYIDFPQSVWGRVCQWYFETQLNRRQALCDHTFRELRYFKDHLESADS